MKKLIFMSLLVHTTMMAEAQKVKKPFFKQTTSELGLSISSNGRMSATSLSIIQYWRVGKNQQHLKLGIGGRLTSSFGSKNLTYITAPAELTSGSKGPGVFFSENIPENIDTLKLASTQVNAINVCLAFRYDFKKKWGLEFNIDAAGFAFGATQAATLTYGEKSDATRKVNAKPSPRNALLISDNDIGSLNSEFMILYKYKNNIKLKVGTSFLFNEYVVDNPVLYTNSKGTVIGTDRYRVKSLTFAIGSNYILNYKK